MSRDNIFETLLSAAVVLVAVGFTIFAYHSTGAVFLSDYQLNATMRSADGLAAGASDVLIAGTKVGSVTALTLDPKTYRVQVSMRIHDDVQIPVDSVLGTSSGIMSSQSALSIRPGKSSKMLAPGALLTQK